jgi:hypothetical protein
MSDGKFNNGRAQQFKQGNITREHVLVVNTSPTGVIGSTSVVTQDGGISSVTIVQPWAASSYASLDPNDTTQGIAEEMGPHWVMSGETSDGAHPFGFKLMLSDKGLLGAAAVADEGGFTVTPWVLAGSAQIVNLPPAYRQQWGGIEGATGVEYMQWYHCFDVNPCAIRVQIGNILTHGLVCLIFAEL